MPLVTLTELAHGGDAVGHVETGGERRAVFVRGGVPGDRLELAIDFSKRPARGTIMKIAEPSADRVEPACPYVAKCGGCDWMHVSHAGQLRAHEAHVRDAVGDVPIEVHPATRTERYRERARLHAKASGKKVIVGPNENARATPIDADACLALHPALDAARNEVARALHGAEGSGEVGLALGAMREKRNVVLELRFSGSLPSATFGVLEAQTNSGIWDGVRVWIEGARAPAVIGDPTPWIEGIDGAPLRLAPGGFAQAHGEMNRALGAWVMKHASDKVKLLELHAGSGNLTIGLAKKAQVIAVESEADAVDAARANLTARGLVAKVVCADAETHAMAGDTHTVVLDPPRTGARSICEALAKSRVKTIVYVSCDPPSLKRDLGFLRERFTVRTAALFEMFPQTSHVESVVVLGR